MTGGTPVLSLLETAHDPYLVQRVRHDAEETFCDSAHEDHNRSFKPYAFRNLGTKYTGWSVTDTIWSFNGISLMLFADKER